jgi:hypothetical protein
LPPSVYLFLSVSLGTSNISYVFRTLIQLYICWLIVLILWSRVKTSYSSTNTYSVQVVSSGNRFIQASLVAPLVAGHPCWCGKNV